MASDTLVSRAVLFAYVDDLYQPPAFLSGPVARAARSSSGVLRIVLLSPFFDTPSHAGAATVDRTSEGAGISHTRHWYGVQRLLTFVYVQATKVAQDLDRVTLDVDVLLKGAKETLFEDVVQGAERVYAVSREKGTLPEALAFVQKLERVILVQPDDHSLHDPRISPPTPDLTIPPLFPVAALGGTFDHLHAGHKILLSMGAWIASEKLIVGLTDDALLKNKAYKEVLEPLSARTERTRAFLQLFKPTITYDLVPISDVYGPTGWDPNIQALVVSKETLPGAASIHDKRKTEGLPELRTFVIDVISATEASVDDADAEVLKSTKMSSTFIRGWLVKRRTITLS